MKQRSGGWGGTWSCGFTGPAELPSPQPGDPAGQEAGQTLAVLPHPRLKDAAVMVVDVKSSLWVTHSSFF